MWIAELLAAMLTCRVQDLVERHRKNNMLTSTGTVACITDFWFVQRNIELLIRTAVNSWKLSKQSKKNRHKGYGMVKAKFH